MTSLAATATGDLGPAACLILIGAVITGCYLLTCWLYPFTTCRRCHGTGKGRGLFGRSFGLCRRCHGNRRQLRAGRHLINHVRALRTNANRYQNPRDRSGTHRGGAR